MRRLLANLRLRLLGVSKRTHPDYALVGPHFDPDFYRDSYPDVAAQGADPLGHFLVYGWREGRDPNAAFSIRGYLAEHPEVAALGVNPFVHALTHDPADPSSPPNALGFRYDVILRSVPMAERLAPAREPVAALPERALVEALGRSRGGLRALHVSVSHDDFTANLGGVQLGLQREAARVAQMGRDHLHLHPARAWPAVRTGEEPGQLGVVWNGERVGVFEPAAVARALKACAGGAAGGRSFAIHSLLGHASEETADILAAAGLSKGFFWLHDFASLCAGVHLLRNDVEDCAAPPPDSPACSICLYGPWRMRHLAEHARLFRRLELTVVSPSQTTLDLWRRAWDHPAAGFVVHPHARLVNPRPAPSVPERPFRLAYAGLPVAHKGWPIFAELAARFAEDARYQFLHIGARRVPGFKGPFREATAGPGRLNAMAEALAEDAPDAVLLWPLCRETFSFVAYEAAAAGCAVITGPDSGNVAAFVAEGDHGRVLPDEAALAAAFESGEILDLARHRRRPMAYDLSFSALTADLLKEAVPA
jgi:hypothetical protein